jgi:hypothetical protein
MQISADIKKNFLQNRWRREFRAKGTISSAQTSILADLLLPSAVVMDRAAMFQPYSP